VEGGDDGVPTQQGAPVQRLAVLVDEVEVGDRLELAGQLLEAEVEVAVAGVDAARHRASVAHRDQDGQPLDRSALLGRDTVIAAFHTTCHETCPLYTGLLFQIRRSSPGVRLVEVTTDPATDVPATLATYRSAIGADWTFATGQADDLAEFWGPLGVSLATGDTHSSGLVLVDRHGYIRAGFTGVPDVGGRLPGQLDGQLDAAGQSLLAGHGEGWGAPQIVDSLRTLAAAGRSFEGQRPPVFSLTSLEGQRLSLEEYAGRPVVVNFWWSGCPPCRQEMPLLQRTADSHGNVAVLLVDPVDGAGTARGFTSSVHVRAPVLLDDGGRVAAAFGVAYYPTTVFVRPDGTIASQYIGALTADALNAHLSTLAGG
jgi:cytochrome oxidase Cu insertion factor (SCO1/SenC/PrrC family)